MSSMILMFQIEAEQTQSLSWASQLLLAHIHVLSLSPPFSDAGDVLACVKSLRQLTPSGLDGTCAH